MVDTAKELVAPEIPRGAVVELDYMSIIDSYPQLRDMPPRDAQIVMLFAAGMTQAGIGQYLNISKSTVTAVLEKYDVSRVIRKSVELQRLLLANSIGSIMVSAITQVRKKVDEFQKMPVAQIVSILKQCVEIQKSLQPSEQVKSDDSKELIERLRSKPLDIQSK
jgi:hypothetical protein